ncbi:interleukin-2 receptor subunit beta-like [Heptranchias perlo]|uniref:interleukin-2 receptor subunit beta-like n=1 Tax=Heptranchias perlo TaxID=212740 RepID=UPI00355969B0
MKRSTRQLGLLVSMATLWLSGLGCKSGEEGLNCDVNYLNTMTCCWSQKFSQNDSLCEVHVEDIDEPDEYSDEPELLKLCSPKSNMGSPKTPSRSCILNFLFFAAAQNFNVTLLCPMDGSQTEVAWIPTFKPMHNIKPEPPYNLIVVNSSSIRTDFSWETNYTLILVDKLEFELRYKFEEEQWKNAKRHPIQHSERRASIESTHLKPNRFYVAQVRTKIDKRNEEGYEGTWSKWSHVVRWKAEEAEAFDVYSDEIHIILWISLSSAGILVVVAILAISQLAKRRSHLKKLHWLSVPDPGKFFYELNSTYGGNFQKWLGTTFPASFSSTEDLSTEISSVEISEVKDSQSFIKQDYVSDSSGFKSIGNSSLSSFANQGYFWFSYPSSYEMDPCKVYFSYDRSGIGSGSEKSGLYRCLTSSDDSLYDSSQQYSPCSVFIGNQELDLDHECSSAKTNASRNALIDEEIECPPREPEDLSNVMPLQFSSELGNIEQLLRNGHPTKGNHDCLNPISQTPLFESSHYPFGSHVSLMDITFQKKDEGISRYGSEGLMFGDDQVGPLPASTETVLRTQCPQDGFGQESACIFKSMSLNLGQSSDAYLSLKEVQSKYSNQSI